MTFNSVLFCLKTFFEMVKCFALNIPISRTFSSRFRFAQIYRQFGIAEILYAKWMLCTHVYTHTHISFNIRKMLFLKKKIMCACVLVSMRLYGNLSGRIVEKTRNFY